MSSNHYDVLVVGCGIVGCAVAREFTLAGCRVGIVEKKSDPVSEASSGNTGHIASFFYYTETRTPIEFKMTRRARNLNREWLAAQKNVTSCKKGLLLPAFTKEELEVAAEMLKIAIQNGEQEEGRQFSFFLIISLHN
jgi:glycerol-3-phosphate dehydrogenase